MIDKYIYVSVILTNVLYLIITFGIVSINPMFIYYITSIVHFSVSIYLILIFNPLTFKPFSLSYSQAYIIFNCAVIILLNMAMTKYVENIFLNKFLQI